MPARKVTTNGWIYWLAKHPSYGLLLFDRADQATVPEGSLRVFQLETRGRIVVPQDVLRRETSAAATDQDFVAIVTAYNGVKDSFGLPPRAPGYDPLGTLEERHRVFLRARGLTDNGIQTAAKRERRRLAHCWSCGSDLDNAVDVECVTCRWIICDCGACGCGR